jgi:hypothetical protein
MKLLKSPDGDEIHMKVVSLLDSTASVVSGVPGQSTHGHGQRAARRGTRGPAPGMSWPWRKEII